jgi:hypothetical protein
MAFFGMPRRLAARWDETGQRRPALCMARC